MQFFCQHQRLQRAFQRACENLGWVDLAWTVYEDVVTGVTQVNVYTLNIMVNALCKEGRFDRVKVFLSEMAATKGVFGDVVTYNTLIYAHCYHILLSEAFEGLNSMWDVRLKPSVYTYNTIINGLCKKRLYERTKSVLDEMLGIGSSPNAATFNPLLVESSRKDDVHETE